VQAQPLAQSRQGFVICDQADGRVLQPTSENNCQVNGVAASQVMVCSVLPNQASGNTYYCGRSGEASDFLNRGTVKIVVHPLHDLSDLTSTQDSASMTISCSRNPHQHAGEFEDS